LVDTGSYRRDSDLTLISEPLKLAAPTPENFRGGEPNVNAINTLENQEGIKQKHNIMNSKNQRKKRIEKAKKLSSRRADPSKTQNSSKVTRPPVREARTKKGSRSQQIAISYLLKIKFGVNILNFCSQ
jgi:hypothetical protein